MLQYRFLYYLWDIMKAFQIVKSAHRLCRGACSGDWVLAYDTGSIGLGSFHAPCTSTAPSAFRDGG